MDYKQEARSSQSMGNNGLAVRKLREARYELGDERVNALFENKNVGGPTFKVTTR